jgi:hypothetical protein
MTLPATWRLGIACIAIATLSGLALAATPADAAPADTVSSAESANEGAVTAILLVVPVTASLLILGAGLAIGSRQRRITESGEES